MKIVGSYNIKGGVGKTACAVNLAWAAARDGMRTMIWDLDPQGAASFYFRIKPRIKKGVKGLLNGDKQLDDLVKGTDFDNLDLMPADFSYRHMDLELDEHSKPTKQLMRLLRPLSQEYDLIVLDCPPSISLVSENIFRAANLILMPVIPTTLSVRTLEQLNEFLDNNHKQFPVDVLPFFSMVDRRKSMHKDIMAQMREIHPQILQADIPYASDVERMGIHREPLGAFAPSSPAAKAYESMWQEVRAIL